MFWAFTVVAQVGADTPWQAVTTSDGSSATARHEAAAVEVDGKLYLLGGRSNRPVEVYDPETRSWRVSVFAPLELHHFQPVAIGTKIYALAAFTCCYPDEPSIGEIYVFDTENETWSVVGNMPAGRVRGAAAAVVRQGMIYVLGGNTLGHNGGAVDWFDRYDPATGEWTILPDAPNARDHFAAGIVNEKLVVAGGRTTELPNPFANPVLPTDVFDFSTQTWSSQADIPTARAGTVAAVAGDEILIAGGEINTQNAAHSVTEAFNVNNNQWRALQPMASGRHSGGAAVVDGIWHIVAGSNISGGGGEFNGHETLDLSIPMNQEEDQDEDGLTDLAETLEHSTDPLNPDTDEDGLNDGDEIDLDTDPLDSDTDADLLSDGEEVNEYNTNPLLKDSDSDGLQDYAEVITVESNPNNPDTDGDGLVDGEEITRGTNPKVADSDRDGLYDGIEIQMGTDPLNMDTDADGLADAVDPNPLDPVVVNPVNEPDSSASKSGAAFGLLLLIGVVSLSRMARSNVKLSSI